MAAPSWANRWAVSLPMPLPDSPTPTATAVPEATPTAAPTATAAPTPTEVPEPTPTATVAPTPTATPAPTPTREENVAAEMESLRNDVDALTSFLDGLPKGADLHSHISGAIPMEDLIAWGAVDGVCVNTSTWYASTTCDSTNVPMSNALTDNTLYNNLLANWSVEASTGDVLADHQLFFDAFGKFGAIQSNARSDDMLAAVMAIAGRNNQNYIELLTGMGSSTIGKLASKYIAADASWTEEYLLGKRLEIMADSAFQSTIDSQIAYTTGQLTGARQLLNCDSEQPDPGCAVTVRWVASANRTNDRGYVFAQWVYAFELVQQFEDSLGVNLVSPEENKKSLDFYNDEMFALSVLDKYNRTTDGRRPVRISLHAGELIPEVIPAGYEDHLTFHIRNAVDVAGAQRIGHGADVLGETSGAGADDLLTTMHDKNVAVEICLSSNDYLLGMAGEDHPLQTYLDYDVPVTLNTDDQGILRLEILDEYLRAVDEQGLDYLTLKRVVRNSLEHSFATGLGLWKTPNGYGDAVNECAGDVPGQSLSTTCADYLAANDKALLQWELEERFVSFEKTVLGQSLVGQSPMAPSLKRLTMPAHKHVTTLKLTVGQKGKASHKKASKRSTRKLSAKSVALR